MERKFLSGMRRFPAALWARGDRPLLQTVLARVCVVLAALSLLYGLVTGIFCGFGVSGLIIWPFASALLILLSLWLGDKPPFRRLRRHRAVRVAVALICAVVVIYCAVVLGLIISGAVADAPDGLDYIIVLGAKVNGETPSLALRCRIDAAHEYLEANPGTVAILSGGKGVGEGISEAEAMRRELVRRGISESRLVCEDKSTSTEENIRFSYDKMPAGRQRVGIVTNNFHVWRALRVAARAGEHEVSGISADYPNLLIINYTVRELVTVTFYLLTGKM